MGKFLNIKVHLTQVHVHVCSKITPGAPMEQTATYRPKMLIKESC